MTSSFNKLVSELVSDMGRLHMIGPWSDKNDPALQGKLQKMSKDPTICFKICNPTKFAKD